MMRWFVFLLAAGLVLPPAALRAAVDPCAADGGTKVADSCDGYASSCCSLDRASRYWCVTYGANDDLKAACVAPCGGPTCGWRCDENPLTGECVTYPVVLGSYQCGQPAAPDPSGSSPWTCKAICSPQCGGKTCGADGCGPAGQQGVCGQCVSDPASKCPLACNANGKCDKVCADCPALGWTCGSNCCGGICGSCTPPSTCDTDTHSCSCVASCAGKACGDDGCGGSCGACGGGLVCLAGACVAGPAEPTPEVVDGGTDPGASDPGPAFDPGAPDPGHPGADVATGPEGVDAGSDAAVASDGGCPDGTSLVSGICLKDPPRHTPRDDSGGGGCGLGSAGGGLAAWVVLAVLATLLARRRSGARG